MELNDSIPQEIKDFCLDLARIAKKHKVHSMKGNFYPKQNWNGDIGFIWEAGRHDEESNDIKIFVNISGEVSLSSESKNSPISESKQLNITKL